VFWVDCGSEASAQGDFERIGDKCGWSLTGGQALVGVKDQLASSKRPSLVILDNCDDVRTDYSRYIPNGSKASVVLTTRLSDAKKYASVDPQDAKSRLFVQLKGLDADSAVKLVLDASEIDERSQQITDQARQIVTALDCHPLAITIASSLIRSAVYSLKEYVDALQQRLAQKELLDEVSEQARYQKVRTTFEVSAEALENLAATDPSAKAALALLDILGFMHHQNVSEEMFVRAWKHEETVLSKFGDADEDEDRDVTHLSAWHVTQCRSVFSSSPPDERTRLFRRARAHLERLSLVSVDGLEKSTSLHLMVHAWARERVLSPGEAWTGVASILALSAEGRTSWQPFTSQLVLHQEANFTTWNGVDEPNNDQWHVCRIWYAYAWQMCQAKSVDMLRICFQLLKQTQDLCDDHLEQPAVMQAQYLLGIAYLADGQISKAVETLEHVVKVQEKLAEDHPSRLASQHALAIAYQANGQISEAVEMLEHVVKVRAKLAEDHPSRLASQHELARAYLDNGQISKAVEMLEHVVKVREKLAEDHPSRLASQHGLAGAYLDNGQISEAVEMLEHVVKVREKLAEDHPDRLASQHALAGAYLDNGQISEAVETLEHVVKVREKLAEDHPSRLASQHALAGAYRDNGQITEAMQLLKLVVMTKQRRYRVNHPSRTVSENLLASLMRKG
jgi:tetratricopeptide (TPR) repeat protein